MTVCQEVFAVFMDSTSVNDGIIGIVSVDTITLQPPDGYDPEYIYIFDSKVSVVVPLPAGMLSLGLSSQESPSLQPYPLAITRLSSPVLRLLSHEFEDPALVQQGQWVLPYSKSSVKGRL